MPATFEARPERWATRAKAIGSGCWRVVGEVDDLLDTARLLGQRWLKGIGLAATLAKPERARMGGALERNCGCP
ncbi:MAG: hypothetical protein JSR26_02985 [Proteobacteria bacterium]|nr:hypothetical protein [Pseudomonadota bacterium]